MRRDGMPIALPVWFVAEDRTVEMMTDQDQEVPYQEDRPGAA
ncbi:MAG: hypothetical protein ACLPXZ_07265 [Mycobacterium sp.]